MKVNIRSYITKGPRWFRELWNNNRINVRIDTHDTWNIDTDLAHIILPLLNKLKQNAKTFAIVDDNDLPDYIISDDSGIVRWHWILNEMIFAFSNHIKSQESKFYSGELDIIWIPIDKDGIELASEDDPNFFAWSQKKGPNDTFKLDQVGLTSYYTRIDNGFRLFGKYYRYLWD